MSYNQSSLQAEYVNMGTFGVGNQTSFDSQQYPTQDPQQQQQQHQQQQQQQQQLPISPPLFHSPLSYERPSNGSSAGSSSGVSSSQSSSCGTSVDFDTLRYKNDMCKSFEDDLFYCPRSLLSAQEQLTCERMDMFMAEQMRDSQSLPQQNASDSSPSLNFIRPKFNPYTSQSFSPAPSG